MILTLQTSTFGVYGGIPTYNRLVCRVLNELTWGGERRTVLLGTDKPTSVAEAAGGLQSLSLEGFNRNRGAFVRRVVDLGIKNRIDMLLVGHVNYAPLALLLKRLQPEMRYGVFMYGIEVWNKLSLPRRTALRKADFNVSISEYTRARAANLNGCPEKRTYLLPNALEMETTAAKATAAGLGKATGTTLLTVCRLDATEAYKGVDQVIEALPIVLEHVPDAQYIIIGSGADVVRLKELAAKVGVSNRVHFLGSVDDPTLRSHYQECDVFVMPSAKEGFGFVFLEAMQYGKPVVAADSGGSPEVVRDGVTGLLVPYGDIAQLALVLTRLCHNPEERERLGQGGYRQLQAQFTFPSFKQILTDILVRELPTSAIYRTRFRALTDTLHAV